MLFMLYSVNWPNFIVWLPLLHNIKGYICIAIVCVLGCDFVNFEIAFICLIKPSKSQDKRLSISRARKAFHVK